MSWSRDRENNVHSVWLLRESNQEDKLNDELRRLLFWTGDTLWFPRGSARRHDLVGGGLLLWTLPASLTLETLTYLSSREPTNEKPLSWLDYSDCYLPCLTVQIPVHRLFIYILILVWKRCSLLTVWPDWSFAVVISWNGFLIHGVLVWYCLTIFLALPFWMNCK